MREEQEEGDQQEMTQLYLFTTLFAYSSVFNKSHIDLHQRVPAAEDYHARQGTATSEEVLGLLATESPEFACTVRSRSQLPLHFV
jgi:hypothetical protein